MSDPELRYNAVAREWVIISPKRGQRPHQVVASPDALPAHRTDCPFCPGHEADTPNETMRLTDDAGNWTVRAFPNRFPALTPGEGGIPKGSPLQRRRPGVGRHEVVAETPLHNLTLAQMSTHQVESVVKVWRARTRALLERSETEHVIVFKNHGAGAGTSIEHPHSQIVSLPVMPAQVLGRLEHATRSYYDLCRCLICEILAEERYEGVRVVSEGRHHTALVPYAAFSPYSVWIIPHRHESCFTSMTGPELTDLARVLRDTLARYFHGLGNPDYNLVVRSVDRTIAGDRYFHWYVACVPRLGKAAGFELGTGMFINSHLPESDAEELRQVHIPDLPTPPESSGAGGETVDLIDLDNRIIGTASRRLVRRENLLHRGVGILCRNSQGQVYVHRRTPTKDVFPNMYDMFVGGVVESGESYISAAQREIGEELGVTAPVRRLFSHLYQGQRNRSWIQLYEVHWDGPIRHQPEEIVWGEWMNEGDLLDWTNQVSVVPDGLDCFYAYLDWRDAGCPDTPEWP